MKAANRPWPSLDEDEVVDYLITEAVAAKVAQEDEKLRKEVERKAKIDAWKQDKSELEAYR